MPNNIEEKIIIKGANEHNLKNIDVEIHRNYLTVITGLSGSGKSSLAFDTLFAEGQRRYIESLSSYARQFLGKIAKPHVEDISGIPPAIAIEQRTLSRNPRSTVGTTTEVYEYLKLLFARVGKIYSPYSGDRVIRHSAKDVSDYILTLPQETKGYILVQINNDITNNSFIEYIIEKKQQGYSRVEYKNDLINIDEAILIYKDGLTEDFSLLIDRFIINNDNYNTSRLFESAEMAFIEGKGKCKVKIISNEGYKIKLFSQILEEGGIVFEEPSVHIFSFNSPAGACPKCEGYGQTIGIDPDLVIPDKSLSVYQDAIVCWRGEVMQEWKKQLLLNANKFDFPVHKSYYELSSEQQELLWTGNKYFEGLNRFFSHLEENLYKIQYRVMLSRYRGKTICPECKGSRLRKEANYIRVGGYTISDIVKKPISELEHLLNNIEIDEHDTKIAERILTEVKLRVKYLNEVGLGYLTLNRRSNSLSGGESQRIMLATQLGSSLVGSLYILDEPSIGLHGVDTQKLINVLKQIRDIGNTVVVVEHDEQIMRSADYIIDMGPGAGSKGGEIIYSGIANNIINCQNSITGKYLSGELTIKADKIKRKWSHSLKILGAKQNNLKNIDVEIPLNCMVVISGVSGSGKTTLIKSILYPALLRYFGRTSDRPGEHKSINGDLKRIFDVEMVDQNPIGKSTRSNPATYVKAYDEIRTLFSQQQSAKQYGFKPSHFSFNVEGGRCEECQGEGIIKIEMQFLSDVTLVCESCNGKRFKDEVLEVNYKNKNIYDVLEMTIDDSIEYFNADDSINKKIVEKLSVLQQVGLGYLKLGQSSSYLSGGESQRLKLALFLSKDSDNPKLFLFDEPTTGLHREDVKKLLLSFNSLIEKGHSVVVIEHNPDIILNADWLIDLGPGGGDKGGEVVYTGNPYELKKHNNLPTSKYLFK